MKEGGVVFFATAKAETLTHVKFPIQQWVVLQEMGFLVFSWFAVELQCFTPVCTDGLCIELVRNC